VLNRFKSYITDNNLCSVDDRILVTVSGGIDSVVLLDLFIQAGYFCGIAHCNFNLRGSESDGDESFIRELANRYEIPVFCKTFETLEYAEINKLSVQMAARELRYDWFEDLRQEQGYDLVSTAHNKNDILETFLINLSRGTGIHGLTGIKSKTSTIIRPLLFASREEIKEYALAHSIEWHEDSSNSTLKYSRNKIRHQILPVFEQLNPKIGDTMIENIQRLSEAEEIYNQAIEQKKEEILIKEAGFISISIEKLKLLSPLKTWLYELLQDYNFSPPVISDIIASLDSISGRQFFSTTHRIVKDRNKLVIDTIKMSSNRKFYIEDPYRGINDPVMLEMDVLTVNDKFEFSRDTSVAFLDLDLLEFPLIIRKWEQGDYFHPLGMQNIKKLSDFFIDLKLSIPQKENLWLLTSGPEIIWVIGLRIDDKFRVGPMTKRVLKIALKEELQ
jgi:tRNA(Ile)-lysidine synthase